MRRHIFQINRATWIVGGLILVFLVLTAINLINFGRHKDSLAKVEEKIPVQVIMVKKGEFIASLEKAQIKAQIGRAKAAVDAAKANMDVTQKD